MGCISGIAKYLLFLFNFLIVVCGIVLIAIGAIILVNEDKGLKSFTDFSVGGFAIAVGAVIFLIAFFGCCGAIKENSCMLTTYAVILIVLLVLQIVLGALAFVAVKDEDDLKSTVHKIVTEVFEKINNGQGTTEQIDVVNGIQQSFECCGVDGPNYWTGMDKPVGCYKDEDRSKELYKDGCADAFREVLTSNIKIIGGIAIGFAVVELVGAIFAFMVRNR